MTEKFTVSSKDPSLIQSVSRAVAILRCFADTQEVGLTDLARQTNLHKSTVAGIVNTLKYEGILESDGNNGSLHLGTELVRISANAKRDLKEIAKPFMKDLLMQTGETISLAARNGTNIVFLEQVESPHSLKFSTRLGGCYPFYCTGMGKAIFSCLPMEEAEKAYYSSKPVTLTKNTCKTFDELRDKLIQAKANGYAIDNCEWEADLRAVAAPILNKSGYPVAALSVSGPSSRVSEAKIAEFTPFVKRTAQMISEALQ